MGKSWSKYGITCLGDLDDTSGIKSFAVLRFKYKLPAHFSFKYLQIRDYLGKNLGTSVINHFMIWDCLYGEQTKSLIGNMYKHLSNFKVDGCEKLAIR